MKERDKRLTEAMGECWHEVKLPNFTGIGHVECRKCGLVHNYLLDEDWHPDFSTWERFGKLFAWFIQQPWKKELAKKIGTVICDCDECGDFDINVHWINPDRFADAVDEFLREREKKDG